LPGKRRRSRSFVISFGDIMLPLIGVVAIGLLLLAGRFFFTSGFSGSDSLPVMTPPQRERPALAKERAPVKEQALAEKRAPVRAPAPGIPSAAARAAEGTARSVLAVPDVLAVPYEEKQSAEKKSGEKKNSVSPERRAPEVLASPSPSSAAAGRAASAAKTHPKPRPALPPKTAPAKANAGTKAKTPGPAAVKPAPSSQKAQTTQKAQNSASGWRVQIGAFATRSAADDIVKRLSKEGYSASVVSEKTVHRVLVRARDRSDASALAARMDRSGFPGAFVIAGP
jgi:cell division protein FtsN